MLYVLRGLVQLLGSMSKTQYAMFGLLLPISLQNFPTHMPRDATVPQLLLAHRCSRCCCTSVVPHVLLYPMLLLVLLMHCCTAAAMDVLPSPTSHCLSISYSSAVALARLLPACRQGHTLRFMHMLRLAQRQVAPAKAVASHMQPKCR